MEVIDKLVNLINDGVKDIKEVYAKEGETFPSLDVPYMPSALEEKTALQVETVVAAALQLVSAIRPAPLNVLAMCIGPFDSAALAVVSQHNVVEILREAGPKGLHISEIGKKASTSPEKLERILRYLASRHMFVEISPSVFANNRTSSTIDTGKSYEEISASPNSKHDNTVGFAALVEHVTDESAKSAAYISDYFRSDAVLSDKPNEVPFNLAYKTSEPIFLWLAQPGHEFRRARFGIAMEGTSRLWPPSRVLESFSWESLAKGSIVVDVGGGIGSTTLVLAREYPHLEYVVQDLPSVVQDSEKYWENNFPEAISSGQVKLQSHDFFTPQPVKDASVFLLRTVLHDWSTSHAKEILSRLRGAAQPTTKVVIVEQIVPYLSKEPLPSYVRNIPGVELPEIPDPLVRGAVSPIFGSDLQMMNMCNGMERTVGDWVKCVEGTGWEISEVRYGMPSSLILAAV